MFIIYCRLEAIPEFNGALATNNKLAAVKKIFLGKIRGPESIAVYKGNDL